MYIIRVTDNGIIAGELLKTYKEGRFTYYQVNTIYNSEYDSDTKIYSILEYGDIRLYEKKKDFLNDLKLFLL